MKSQEVRDLTVEEINLKIDELEEGLQTLAIQHSTKQLENPLRIRDTRRDIARLKTILREQTKAEAANVSDQGSEIKAKV